MLGGSELEAPVDLRDATPTTNTARATLTNGGKGLKKKEKKNSTSVTSYYCRTQNIELADF